MLSVQPGPRSSNDLRVGRKMATFQLFLQAGLAKDLSAHLYIPNTMLGSEGYEVYWGREFVTSEVMPSNTGNAILVNKGKSI